MGGALAEAQHVEGMLEDVRQRHEPSAKLGELGRSLPRPRDLSVERRSPQLRSCRVGVADKRSLSSAGGRFYDGPCESVRPIDAA